MSARWRGSRKLEEQPDSPDFDFAEQNTCTRKFSGPFDLCVASRPVRGEALADYPEFFVDKSHLARQEGDRGLLTVTATADPDEEDVGQGPQYKYEIQMVQMERPLLQHPTFRYGGDWTVWGYFANPFPNMSSGAYLIPPDELVAIQLWEKCPTATIKNEGKYYRDNAKRTPADGVALTGEGQKLYCCKRLAGIESYAAFHPVARLTTTQIGAPQMGRCGQIFTSEDLGDLGFDSLPTDEDGADYVWLKTGDNRTRTGKSGKWERIQEWTGASYWDEHLYKPYIPP